MLTAKYEAGKTLPLSVTFEYQKDLVCKNYSKLPRQRKGQSIAYCIKVTAQILLVELSLKLR